jgi:hypothetical protein
VATRKQKDAPKKSRPKSALVGDGYKAKLKAAVEHVRDRSETRLEYTAIWRGAEISRSVFYRLTGSPGPASLDAAEALRGYLMELCPELELEPAAVPIRSPDEYLWYRIGEPLRTLRKTRYDQIVTEALDVLAETRVAVDADRRALDDLAKLAAGARPGPAPVIDRPTEPQPARKKGTRN